MLDRNRLQPPPMPTGVDHASWDWSEATMSGLFTFADDYDQTGILAGVDASESRYWWMPELYATADVGGQPADVEGASTILERTLRGTHAARRAGSRSTAAA